MWSFAVCKESLLMINIYVNNRALIWFQSVTYCFSSLTSCGSKSSKGIQPAFIELKIVLQGLINWDHQMKNLIIYIKGKTSADAQAVLRWDATWKPQIKLQRQETENHLPVRIVFLLPQSPNLSWVMGLKCNGRNTSQVQCFNQTPIFKPNLPVNPVWTELLLFKQCKREGSSGSRSASQTMHMSLHRWSWCHPSWLNRSREGNTIHADHTVIWLQLTLLPHVTFPHSERGWFEASQSEVPNLASQRKSNPAALVPALSTNQVRERANHLKMLWKGSLVFPRPPWM